MTYCIKEGYRCNCDRGRNINRYSCDEESSSKYQVRVYAYAKGLIKGYNLRNVLDVGCGYGLKLKEIIYPLCDEIVGVDAKHSIEFCKRSHSFGQWFEDDIENTRLKLDRKFDLVICSDVVEHLVDPDKLIKYIKEYCHEGTHVVLSTPERDKIRGRRSSGPPENAAHVREWNMLEFREYLTSRGFRIIKHFLVMEEGVAFMEIIKRVMMLRPLKKCQVVHCQI
jgi:SAM-dependent methyltransferase